VLASGDARSILIYAQVIAADALLNQQAQVASSVSRLAEQVAALVAVLRQPQAGAMDPQKYVAEVVGQVTGALAASGLLPKRS
ncbi:MAG: hypothetical protein ACRDTJ_16940, partial [Pseudonocardiaceae bacterium]